MLCHAGSGCSCLPVQSAWPLPLSCFLFCFIAS
uniref:Uncharacterized protein n=1 Tax=Anguilla anguilla TaxID=7936 RepID=A0A0E9PIT2_ANGAN